MLKKGLLSQRVLHLRIFFKQKTAYVIVVGNWSSDVCSSDLKGCIDGVSKTDPNSRNSHKNEMYKNTFSLALYRVNSAKTALVFLSIQTYLYRSLII